MVQSYKWKGGVCMLKKAMLFQLTIKQGNKRVPIKFVPPQKLRVLVRVEVILLHNIKSVLETYKLKVNQFIAKLHSINLSPSLILQGYQAFW